MRLPVLQPPSPDAPSTAVSSEPINREVTLQVLDLTENLVSKSRGGLVPIQEVFDQLGRRKHKAGSSRPTLLWSLWHLWNSGTIAFEPGDPSDESLPKGKQGVITQKRKGGAVQEHVRLQPVRIGYVTIASHGYTDLASGSAADKYRHGPAIDKPSKSGLSLPEKTWPGHPLDWVAKGAPMTVAYGVGVDSTAVLVEMVRQGLPIDLILFADVGSEKPETRDYLPVMNKFLRKHGYPEVTVVRYEMTPQGIARRVSRAAEARKLLAKGVTHWPGGGGDDLPKEVRPIDPRGYTSLGENCVYNLTYPSLAFGFQDHNCSAKWKVKPQVDFIASSQQFGPRAQEAWAAGLPVVRVIGFDAGPGDRGRRDRIPDDIHHLHWYPLQDWGWDRKRAMQEIRKAGLPVPVKSACFFCPSTQPEEVEWLVREHPEIIEEIRLIEDTARPYNEGGPQQGLWYLGSKLPEADQKRFGHEYWFGGGTASGEELERFVEMHYLRDSAVPQDPAQRIAALRRIIKVLAPGLSVRQLQRKDKGAAKITTKTGGEFSPEHRKLLSGMGLASDPGDTDITISPQGAEILLEEWFKDESLRAMAAAGAPTPGRMSDFATAYRYLCKHHPEHARCKGWHPTGSTTSYGKPNPVAFSQGGRLPPWEMEARGGPKLHFAGNDAGDWIVEPKYVPGAWDWRMGVDRVAGIRGYMVDGATEYHPGFRQALREIAEAYPEIRQEHVKFDGPWGRIDELVDQPFIMVDWSNLKLYHGTSDKAWQAIKRSGLIPRAETGAAAAYGASSAAKEGNPHYVYLTSQLQMAHAAARDAAKHDGGRPVVIAVKRLYERLVRPDEDAKGFSPAWADAHNIDQWRSPTADWSLAKLGSIAYDGSIRSSWLHLVECCCDENHNWYPCEEPGAGYEPNPVDELAIAASISSLI